MVTRVRDLPFLVTLPSTSDIYTLSLHDALPIFVELDRSRDARLLDPFTTIDELAERDHIAIVPFAARAFGERRSEEHTSELQSPDHLVCRLLLEKKNNYRDADIHHRQRR